MLELILAHWEMPHGETEPEKDGIDLELWSGDQIFQAKGIVGIAVCGKSHDTRVGCDYSVKPWGQIAC